MSDLVHKYVRFIFDEYEKDKYGWVTKESITVADFRHWFIDTEPCTCPGFHPVHNYHTEDEHELDCYGIRTWLVGEMCGGCLGCLAAQRSYYDSLEEKENGVRSEDHRS